MYDYTVSVSYNSTRNIDSIYMFCGESYTCECCLVFTRSLNIHFRINIKQHIDVGMFCHQAFDTQLRPLPAVDYVV